MVGAALCLAAGIVLSGASDVDASLGAPSNYLDVDAATAVFMLVVGAADGVFAWGAWTLQRWAWTLGIVTQWAGLLGAGWLITTGVLSPWRAGAMAAIHAAVIAYLMSAEARRAFLSR